MKLCGIIIIAHLFDKWKRLPEEIFEKLLTFSEKCAIEH